MRRPRRHSRSPLWLYRNQLTDLLAAAEDAGGYGYVLACLLGLKRLRVSEACRPDGGDLGGARYQPTLRIVGKGDKPVEVPPNPRRPRRSTRRSTDAATAAPLNRWGNRMQRHNAVIVTRLARTMELLQGVPLREMQRAARHTRADTTVGYDQSDRSFHRDQTFVLMTASAR